MCVLATVHDLYLKHKVREMDEGCEGANELPFNLKFMMKFGSVVD